MAGLAWGAETFPALEGENLLGKKVALPEAVRGRTTVVVTGFTHAANGQMSAWGKRLEAEYQPWSIAVLEDAPRLVRGMAISGIKSGVAEGQRGRYVILTAHEKELKAAAGFAVPNDAYVLVLDKDGAVKWTFHGPVTEAALAQLKEKVEGAK